MLLNTIEDIALKVISLSLGVYALEKTRILDQLRNTIDSDEMVAVKVAGILAGSEYIGEYALSKALGRTTPKLYNNIQEFGFAFVSNAVVLYAMDKLKLDDKIITSGNDEGRALQYAVLFVIVQEVSHRVLKMLVNFY
jgi:hypothetical protein